MVGEAREARELLPATRTAGEPQPREPALFFAPQASLNLLSEIFEILISFRGRRSQEDVSLNSLDYGVFGAFKYGLIFLSLRGPEVFSWVSRSSKKSHLIWTFQWRVKATLFFLVISYI